MNKIFLKYLQLLFVGLIVTSCVSSKKMVYFQDNEGVELNETIVSFEPTIQTGDLLNITVSALDAAAAVPFNLYETPVSNGSLSTNAKPIHYLVDNEGAINFPVLGRLKVAGSSTKELSKQIINKLKEYLVNPIVNIRLTNFKVTVLGEVKTPGSFVIQNERITIIEAIGLAGDLKIQGKRTSITLIREQEGKRIFVPVDLTSKKLFNSPYYYLAQNDVIYVEPNKTKINSSVVGANTSIIISSISTLISLIAILTR